jgi:glycosyltransferase 2 family protein
VRAVRESRTRRAPLVLAVLRWLFVVGILGFISWQVARQWDAVVEAVSTIGIGGVAGSIAATLAGLGATGVAWRALLAGLGSPLRPPAAAGIFFVAQLGKYLPGSVWPYVAQARMARAHGVPVARSATAGILFVLMHCATGAVIAAAVLPLTGDPAIQERFGWLPWVAPWLLVALHPAVVHRALTLVHRLTRRGDPPRRLPWPALLIGLASLAVAWVCYGAALFALVVPLSGASWEAWGLSFGGFALAWTAGFLAAAVLVVAAPAGLGVREVALYFVLGPLLSGGALTAVVVFSRIGQLIGDVVWAALGAMWSRRAGPHAASHTDQL